MGTITAINSWELLRFELIEQFKTEFKCEFLSVEKFNRNEANVAVCKLTGAQQKSL